MHEKHRLPVFPVAVFSYDQPAQPEPDVYRIEFPGQRILVFSFRVIQLNRLNWRDYLRNPNPVASALMARMHIAPEDRPRVKLECLRMLATLRLDKARATLISAFMDKYLTLTAAETMMYNREAEGIEPSEREAVMQLTNEWIERGKVEGRVEGLNEGRVEGRVEGRTEGFLQGRRELILRLLHRRLGLVPLDVAEGVRQLSDARLDEFGEALLDVRDVADANRWLSAGA